MIPNLVAGFIGVSPVSLTDYESIATVTVGGAGAATIDFTAISGSYSHLQIRGIGRTNRSNSGGGDFATIRFNSDTGSNYAYHELFGNGSSAGAQNGINQTYGFFERMADNAATSGMFGVAVIDLLDYSNTSKFKTIRNLGGYDNNSTGGSVMLGSSLWRSTSAITSISLAAGVGTGWVQYSSFALYGIK
jgi:hypothetical protein